MHTPDQAYGPRPSTDVLKHMVDYKRGVKGLKMSRKCPQIFLTDSVGKLGVLIEAPIFNIMYKSKHYLDPSSAFLLAGFMAAIANIQRGLYQTGFWSYSQRKWTKDNFKSAPIFNLKVYDYTKEIFVIMFSNIPRRPVIIKAAPIICQTDTIPSRDNCHISMLLAAIGFDFNTLGKPKLGFLALTESLKYNGCNTSAIAAAMHSLYRLDYKPLAFKLGSNILNEYKPRKECIACERLDYIQLALAGMYAFEGDFNKAIDTLSVIETHKIVFTKIRSEIDDTLKCLQYNKQILDTLIKKKDKYVGKYKCKFKFQNGTLLGLLIYKGDCLHLIKRHDLNTLVNPKLGCNNCGRMDYKLKNCKGCNVVVYCSKKCQKQAWKKIQS